MHVSVERLIDAPTNRVMAALTDPAELTAWCCEHAEIDAVTYLLLGESVPQAAMGGALLERTERMLRFAWNLRQTPAAGEAVSDPSVVEVRAEPLPTGTRVRVAHTGIPKGALPGNRWEKDSWECVWSLWLRLLAGWAERRETVGAFDYTAPVQSLPFVRELLMPVGADRVWRALVDEAVRERWLTVPLGREIAREEGRRITFEWTMPEGSEEERITWELETVKPDLTRVTLHHHGLPVPLWDMEIGWHDYLVALYQEAVK